MSLTALVQCCPHPQIVSQAMEGSDKLQFSFLSSGGTRPLFQVCPPLLHPPLSFPFCKWVGRFNLLRVLAVTSCEAVPLSKPGRCLADRWSDGSRGWSGGSQIRDPGPVAHPGGSLRTLGGRGEAWLSLAGQGGLPGGRVVRAEHFKGQLPFEGLLRCHSRPVD